MMSLDRVQVTNDLVKRLEEFLRDQGISWSVEQSRVGHEELRIPSDSSIVREFLDDPEHLFRHQSGPPEDWYRLPYFWSYIKVLERGSFARATAVLDRTGKVRLIAIFDRKNRPGPVELFS